MLEILILILSKISKKKSFLATRGGMNDLEQEGKGVSCEVSSCGGSVYLTRSHVMVPAGTTLS